MKNKDNVTARLKVRLLSGQSITSLEAIQRWGCTRLAAVINVLRNQGMDIKTELIRNNGKSYASYSLVKKAKVSRIATKQYV